jgi:hypothetical protein
VSAHPGGAGRNRLGHVARRAPGDRDEGRRGPRATRARGDLALRQDRHDHRRTAHPGGSGDGRRHERRRDPATGRVARSGVAARARRGGGARGARPLADPETADGRGGGSRSRHPRCRRRAARRDREGELGFRGVRSALDAVGPPAGGARRAAHGLRRGRRGAGRRVAPGGPDSRRCDPHASAASPRRRPSDRDGHG